VVVFEKLPNALTPGEKQQEIKLVATQVHHNTPAKGSTLAAEKAMCCRHAKFKWAAMHLPKLLPQPWKTPPTRSALTATNKLLNAVQPSQQQILFGHRL
jgi:hypothetical protein